VERERYFFGTLIAAKSASERADQKCTLANQESIHRDLKRALTKTRAVPVAMETSRSVLVQHHTHSSLSTLLAFFSGPFPRAHIYTLYTQCSGQRRRESWGRLDCWNGRLREKATCIEQKESRSERETKKNTSSFSWVRPPRSPTRP